MNDLVLEAHSTFAFHHGCVCTSRNCRFDYCSKSWNLITFAVLMGRQHSLVWRIEDFLPVCSEFPSSNFVLVIASLFSGASFIFRFSQEEAVISLPWVIYLFKLYAWRKSHFNTRMVFLDLFWMLVLYSKNWLLD